MSWGGCVVIGVLLPALLATVFGFAVLDNRTDREEHRR